MKGGADDKSRLVRMRRGPDAAPGSAAPSQSCFINAARGQCSPLSFQGRISNFKFSQTRNNGRVFCREHLRNEKPSLRGGA